MKTFLCSALFLLIFTVTCSATSVEMNASVIKEGKDEEKADKINALLIKEWNNGTMEWNNGTMEWNNGTMEWNNGTNSEEIDEPVIIEADCSKCPKYDRPMDCAELGENGVNESGIYTIYPQSRVTTCGSIQVYCDMETDGGGWTMIQRRGQYGNGEDYFNKNWNEYKEGFGNLNKEFWLGNDNIYAITNRAQYAVRMVMTNKDWITKFYQYENFWIQDEAGYYLIRLSEGSGPAGDAIGNHDGWRFYTKDKPDQTRDGIRSGGWWRNGIGTSSLNGLNLYKTDKVNSGDGINWLNFGGAENSFESTEIKIRPKKFNH